MPRPPWILKRGSIEPCKILPYSPQVASRGSFSQIPGNPQPGRKRPPRYLRMGGPLRVLQSAEGERRLLAGAPALTVEPSVTFGADDRERDRRDTRRTRSAIAEAYLLDSGSTGK